MLIRRGRLSGKLLHQLSCRHAHPVGLRPRRRPCRPGLRGSRYTTNRRLYTQKKYSTPAEHSRKMGTLSSWGRWLQDSSVLSAFQLEKSVRPAAVTHLLITLAICRVGKVASRAAGGRATLLVPQPDKDIYDNEDPTGLMFRGCQTGRRPVQKT